MKHMCIAVNLMMCWYQGIFILVITWMQVDYGSSPMVMYKPHKVKVRRSFEYGIWLQHRTSKHQTQLHLKIHRLQVCHRLLFLINELLFI